MNRTMELPVKSQETSNELSKQFKEGLDTDVIDLIDQTRKAISKLKEQERFKRAKVHLDQAMKYQNPRIEIFDKDQGCLFRLCYHLQTSYLWLRLTRTISFLYMYLIIFDQTSYRYLYSIGSMVALSILWLDLLMALFHTVRDRARKTSKYSPFYFKTIILILLLVEQVLVARQISTSSGRPINPLRILRATLPFIYVSEVKRSFEALFSAYGEVIMFGVFYFSIIATFGLISNIIINVPETMEVNTFTNNYGKLGHMIFIIYVTGSYDSYPDNQLLSFQISRWFQIFFVVFIFLNMFLFSSIPGSLLFDSYINTRSKYILIDEIKMQHSLILAFISLGDTNYEINIMTIIEFFHYIYQDRVRCIDAITQVCLKLNNDGNCSVHVIEFIQLGRILQENPYLQPPPMPDLPLWIQFRSAVNDCIPLKKWMEGRILPAILGALALWGVINSFCLLYNSNDTVILLNKIISHLLVIDIVIRIIAQGPENYWSGQWNFFDLWAIVSSIAALWISSDPIYSALIKTFRFFRISPLMSLLFQNDCIRIQLAILDQLKKLISTVIIIIPIFGRFIPIFMVTYYVIGILGLQLFYDTARQQQTTYSFYDQFSHFRQFINTQFYLVQVLTEAGWSMVAFDYSSRNYDKYSLVMMFFVMCHLIIVLVLSAVLKGIIWFVFLTVAQLYDEQQKSQREEASKQDEMKQKVDKFKELQTSLDRFPLYKYDTFMKRNLFQLKADKAILLIVANMQRLSNNNSIKKSFKRQRTINLNLYKQFQNSQSFNGSFNRTENNFLFTLVSQFKSELEADQNEENQIRLQDMQYVDTEDIYLGIQKLMKTFKIVSNKFEYQGISSSILNKHLVQKLKAPYRREIHRKQTVEADIQTQEFSDKRSLQFHVFTLHLILDIRTQYSQQKSLVVDSLCNSGFVDYGDKDQLMHKCTYDQTFGVDDDNILRQMYLAGTDSNIIQKFQAEYFGDIFGSSFKQTNKVTIQPLIKLESTLTYALKKLMRQPTIRHIQFFKILSEIETNIGSKLLKKGSLFKFVFQLNTQKDIWFTVHFTPLDETRISFLKHGVWMYHEDLRENQIYYGKDIFKTGQSLEDEEMLTRATLMKKLFQTFETLALTLNQSYDFFQSNPSYHQYDTYLAYTDVSAIQRLMPQDLQISKIMTVMLTKESQRPEDQPLQYYISDIQIDPPVDNIDFNLNEAESKTYRKLSNLCALTQQDITANEGLPFAYVLNLLCEINDILKLYAPNFVHQIESVLNDQLSKVCEPAKVINLFQQTSKNKLLQGNE